MAEPVVFVDTETTGLDPDRHAIWEIALVTLEDTSKTWRLDPGYLPDAEPDALRISRFYLRSPNSWDNPRDVAREIALRTEGMHLVGAVPEFDARFLKRFLHRHGFQAAWHYQSIDVEVMAAGLLGLRPPIDTSVIDERLGIKRDEMDRHTAVGDARWAREVYLRVLNNQSPTADQDLAVRHG